jgi:hypothetical protein
MRNLADGQDAGYQQYGDTNPEQRLKQSYHGLTL